MRLLLVIRSLGIGGAERQCAELACALTARGHEVTLCTLGQRGTLEGLLDRGGVKLVSLGHGGRITIGRTAMRLRKLCCQYSPDVIYSFLSVANLLCAIALPKRHRCRLVWGVRASWMDLPEYGLFARGVIRLEAALSRRPRLIIANSMAGMNHHIRIGYPANRMRCVENRIDTRRFLFTEAGRVRFREMYGVANGDRVFALVGRVDPIKGHNVFIRAVATLAHGQPDMVFWCVGDGIPELKAELVQFACRLGVDGRIRWLGDVMDMPAMYSAADVVVSASRAEGFPNVIAEALACGTPVVATDVGDTRRMVGHSGRCVAAGNVAALAAAMRDCAQCALPLREEIRSDFIRRFDPEFLLDTHESMLKMVADNGQDSALLPSTDSGNSRH